ncbi:hypothetical protein NOJ28_15855 [Neorhizobium galegae]|uniref:hypothetical protein n=2 Tax=Neorhizobium galegae TaxID=399 RepID=UPI0021058AE9|nr:hypothetical protein [Neorhizobium galegae]MCQ1767012.1 hypothetical protein [Neorhizobium galegae]MCQ1849021.1 hypothetical protein [Neorhizobium galegae]
MAQLMIVDMDGLPMSPGSATALLFRASFKKPLAMRSLPRTNVSSRFLLGPFLTIPVPSQQFLSHVFWMFPEHNKRICDAIFPPWIVVTSHSLYIVEIEPDNIRQEEKTLARLAEMFAYRLDDLCQIVRPCDQANVDVTAGAILSTGDASVQPHSGDTTAQLFAAGLYLFEDIMKPFAFRPEELANRIGQGMLRVEVEQARPVRAFLYYQTVLP